jgi:Predicted transmembrane transcriptional regulator (anti-sigma factor)
MQCNQENLQMYLDGELGHEARKSVEEHLGQCRSCRQEIARLQLLWLELGQGDDVELPAALPYLRQQIVSQAIFSRKDNQNPRSSYWDTQKLAWQPAILGASYLPGLSLINTVRRAATRRLKSGSIALARRLVMPSQKG